MNKSPEIGELIKAFVEAQPDMRAAKKSSENPFFRSKYADLGSVMEACLPPLNKHGIGITQLLCDGPDGRPAVETMMMHRPSGQWISSVASATPTKNDPQGYGSVYSYLKRYGMQAIACVPSEDDDGAHASSQPLTQAVKQPPREKIYTDSAVNMNALADAIRKVRPNASKEAMRKLHESYIGKPIDLVMQDVKQTVEQWGAQ